MHTTTAAWLCLTSFTTKSLRLWQGCISSCALMPRDLIRGSGNDIRNEIHRQRELLIRAYRDHG